MDAFSSGSKQRPLAKGRNGDLKKGDERLLWGRAGGRCQRCNVDVSKDAIGWHSYNLAENAHIVASSSQGVRGSDENSIALAEKLENHLLLCRPCHKIIDDKHRGEKLFPTEALFKLKRDQEALVQRLMDLAKKPQSVAIYVSAAVGEARLQPLMVSDINMAIVNAGLVPALNHPIHIDLLSLLEVETLDSDPEFWMKASRLLRRAIESQVIESTHSRLNEVEHFSLFGMAPIPVLSLLGSLIPDTRKAMVFQPIMAEINPGRATLSDKIEVDIRQFDRDAASWCWPDSRTLPPPKFSYEYLSGGGSKEGKAIAVLFELSFPTHIELVEEAIPQAVVYKFYAEEINPNLIQAHGDVEEFMRAFRRLLSDLEREYGHDAHVHIFGALPVSCAIALGRIQVKGSLPMTIYNLHIEPSRYEPSITLTHEV